jgi:hypothetical protein
MDPLDLTRKYQENIGSHPGREIPLLTAGAGTAGYLAAGPLIRALVNSSAIGSNPQVKQMVTNFLVPGGDIETTKRRIAVLSAAAGLMYGLYKHADWRNGWQGFISSTTKPGYWQDKSELAGTSAKPLNPMDKDLAEMTKAVSMDKQALGADEGYMPAVYTTQDIPVGHSINMIRNDPFLFQASKTRVSGILTDSANGDQFTSKLNLTNAAIRAGADFGTAFLFGQGVGRLLALPSPIINRVSTAGGMAAAVIGSGILRKL